MLYKKNGRKKPHISSDRLFQWPSGRSLNSEEIRTHARTVFIIWGVAMGQPEKTISATLLWMLAGLTIAAVAWDVYVIAWKPSGTWTISDQLEYLTYKYPILAFIAGLLIGHIFHRSNGKH